MIDLITLAIAKKYTSDTAIGLGAVKGAPCTISKTEQVQGGNQITFKWTGDDGSTNTRKITVYDGISVVGGEIGVNKHLYIILSNGNRIDCGELPLVDSAEDVSYTNVSLSEVDNVKEALDSLIENSIDDAEDVLYTNTARPTVRNVKQALDIALNASSSLEKDLTVSNPVGQATNGKTYAKNTPIETVLRDMLIKEIAPSLNLSIVPSTTLYDVVDTVISAITMNAQVSKNTYNLSKIDFYVDGVKKHTENISANGTYSYNVTFSPPTNSNFTLKATVYDSKSGTPMSTSKSISVKFVGKSYYGTVNADVGEPTEAVVKALQNNVLKDTKGLKYEHITMDYGKVVYAYPASFGDLTSIKDVKNNLNYFESFSKITVSVDGLLYNCYTQIDPSASTDVELTFA